MIVLDNWQQEAMEHKGNLLLCTGRRVGKTYIMAKKAIIRMLERRIKVVVVSLTEEQAMLMITTCKNIIEEIDSKAMKKRKEETNKKTITLKNGSTMISRPVGDDGDSLRGYEANILIVDEAARMGKRFWAAATPLILTTRGEIWLCSTPHGKQGYFWERFNESYNNKEENALYKTIYISTEQIIKERPISVSWTIEAKEAAQKILETEKRTMSPMEYGQEYMGLFLDELRQFFSDELIEKSCVMERQKIRGTVYMGVDIARMGDDSTTYEMIDKLSDDRYIHIENIVKKKQDTYITEQEIIQLSQMFNVKKIGIDAGSGSLGVGIYDRLLHNPITRSKVIAMANQKISTDRNNENKQRILKEDMYDNLRYMMETNKLKLLNDNNLKMCLKSIQIEVTDGKTKIFAHPSGDIVEGLIRSAYLAQKEKVNKLYITSM
jgi:hypothetical protein